MFIFVPWMGLLIALAVGLYIFLPYFWEEPRDVAPQEIGDGTGREKEKLMTDLANLEYDFRSGKIDEAGYQLLRTSVETKLFEAGGQISTPPAQATMATPQLSLSQDGETQHG